MVCPAKHVITVNAFLLRARAPIYLYNIILAQTNDAVRLGKKKNDENDFIFFTCVCVFFIFIFDGGSKYVITCFLSFNIYPCSATRAEGEAAEKKIERG